MIDPTDVLESWEFKQDPAVYAIVYLKAERKVAIAPAILLGERPTILIPDDIKHDVIAFTVREAVIKHMDTITQAETMFREMVSLNIANMFFAYVNNIFLDDQMRAVLGSSSNLGLQGMTQEFVDFLAALTNKLYLSGTEEMFLAEELKIFIGTLLQAAQGHAVMYSVMTYAVPAIKRFRELYYQQPKQVAVEVLADDTLSFIGGLFEQ